MTEKAARSTQLEKLRQPASQSAIASNNYPRRIKFSIFLQRARFSRVPPRVWPRRKYKSRPACGYYLSCCCCCTTRTASIPQPRWSWERMRGIRKTFYLTPYLGYMATKKKRYTANLLKAQFSFHTGDAHMRLAFVVLSGHNFPKWFFKFTMP